MKDKSNNLKLRIMKANFVNLVNVLKMRFDGKVRMGFYLNGDNIEDFENVPFELNDVQIGVYDTSTATIADLRTIVNTFFEDAYGIMNINYGWGFVEIYVSDGTFKKKIDKVSLEIMKMVLPIDKAKLIK